MLLGGSYELLIVGGMLAIPVILGGGLLFMMTRSRQEPPTPGALQPCPDCRRSISRRAASCPHCGCPLDSTAPPRP